MTDAGSAAVFLDRDGVINELVFDPDTGDAESPYRPADVEIISGAGQAIEALAAAGLVLVVVSNQPAAAKGRASAEALDRVHERVIESLGPAASLITSWRYCRHHPEAEDPANRECDCRKPKPGMLIAAAGDLGLDLSRSWMVGDADRDISAGASAGCRTILIANPASAHRRTGSRPDLYAASLQQASDALLTMPS